MNTSKWPRAPRPDVPFFEKRHFEWLADFAATNLTPQQSSRLASELVATNPDFKRALFITRACRNAAPDLTERLISRRE